MVYFRCQYQSLLNLLTFCVFLGVAAVCGCSEPENRNVLAPTSTVEITPNSISKEMVAELLANIEKNMFAAEMELAPQFAAAPMAPMQRLPTIAETMAALRLEFPGNVLDDDFTRIQEIIESETYLDFLKRTYPQENQFRTFDAFWELASVDEEGYMEFLNTHFKPPLAEPTAEDVEVLHYMTLFHRNLNVRRYHDESIQVNDALLEMLINEPVYSWLKKRFSNANGGLNVLLWLKVFMYHDLWVKKMQEEDRKKIQAFFLERGAQKGFLRFALQEPVSLGYFLKDFPNTQVFQRWVDGEFSKNGGQQGQRPENERQ